MRFFKYATCFALAAMLVVAYANPTANIPHSKNSVTLDGVLANNEWNDAAELRNICQMGTRNAPLVNTEFRVKYDKDYLYVAAVCHESDIKYPESYNRPWHDLFFNNDDAVQVVIGVADPEISERGKVNVGGYVGAMGSEFTAADFYYMFTVNSINSKQRLFNEAPLENPFFESATKVDKGKKYVIEMKIPFKSAGLKNINGQTIYANFFRFRPPVTSAWHSPDFGGYLPMPLGKITFVEDNVTPTLESFPIPKATKIAKSCKINLLYGPLNGSIIGEAEITGEYPELFGVLEISGEQVIRKKLNFQGALDRDRNPLPNKKALVFKDFPVGNQVERLAKFRIEDAKGIVLASTEKLCPATKAPEFLNTQVAKEYINEKIPAPWTKPEIKGNSVKLLDKSIAFGEYALPNAILRGDKEDFLSGNSLIKVKNNNQTLSFKLIKKNIQPEHNTVKISNSLKADNLDLETRAMVDFDGFIEYKFELQGEDLANIDQVSVEIPLRKGFAKNLLPGSSVQKAGALTGAGYRTNATQLWIGNEEEGLSINFDIDPFLSRDLRRQMEIVQNDKEDILTLNLVDGKNQLQGKKAIFRFFLQPTPTKPYPERPVRDWVRWEWEGWSRWHGYPDLSKIETVKKQAADLKQQGKILTLYCCQGLQENAPEMEAFRSDLEILPKWRYYFWQGKDAYATCKRGPEGELQLVNYQKIIKDGNIRGLMSDGLSCPWGDANPLHREGCGRPVELDIDKDTRSMMIVQREFLKRMRGLFTDTNEEFSLVAHTGGGIDVNTLSFFDSYFEGEQLMRFRRGYYPSEAMFGIAYSGLPWGWRTIYWPKQLHNYDGLDTALAYALLFNSEYYTNPDTEPDNIDVELLVRFGGNDSKFYPFWNPQKLVDFDSENCYMSIYNKLDESMIVISNLRYVPNEYKLDFSRLYPNKAVEIRDYLLDKKLDSKEISETLNPFSCRIITIKVVEPTKLTASTDLLESNSFNDWKLTTGAKLTLDSIVLAGTPTKNPATAVFKKFLLGRAFNISFDVKMSGRFGVKLGNVSFIHDNGWVFYGANGEDTIGVNDRFMNISPDRFYFMNITYSEGKLSIKINDREVVRGRKIELAKEPFELVLSTWHDSVVEIKDLYVVNQAQTLTTSNRQVVPFCIKKFVANEWIFENAASDLISADGELTLQASPEKGLAMVEFAKTFGNNFYCDMLVRLPERFSFVIGGVELTYGGGFPGWGWMARGNASAYGRGWIFQAVPLELKEFKRLEIFVRDGVISLYYNNKLVVKDLAMNMANSGNTFSMRTWHDDKIQAKLVELSTTVPELKAAEVIHPIVEGK